MIRRCDGQDPNLRRYDEETGEGRPCVCGKVFDDVWYLTVWPHERV